MQTRTILKNEEPKNIDEWYDLYTEQEVNSTVFDNEDEKGQLETYGDDYDIVLEIHNKTPNRVWSFIEVDDELFMVAGLHKVNVLYYVITNEEFKTKGGEFKVI